MLLSVIVPCYNEEAVLRATHERLTGVLAGMSTLDYELIFVNDGSHDDTQLILTQLQLVDPHVRVLLFSRNFGHQIAVTAGLEEASGDAVVIIDADLQDPPEVIPQMVQLWRDGNDVVYGLRIDRKGESKFKLWTAKALLSTHQPSLRNQDAARHRRLSPARSPSRRSDQLDAGTRAVSARHGELGRLSPGFAAVRARRATRRHEQVSA